ncbi:Nuclear pore complex protein NUP1 [Vitis vinifera]|uniref:Nuclear pore complex protein NUP1 n=1 Tax=Vitis vinifera TaxID=29760 RepID=A0A438H392_VITVI|nr:Nuclear pore complex protein NUP1 [Vitis vinifera]
MVGPSPKEKSSELKLAAAREKSPAKLTPTMLRGQALKSLENVDSSKILENVPNNNKLSDMLTACVPDARDSTFQKPDKVQNGPTKFFDGSISVVNNVDTTTSSKGTMPSVKTADSAMMNSAIHPPTQKKRAFQMSAHEVYLELDDDFYPNGLASNPLVESREKLDKSLVDVAPVSSMTVPPVMLAPQPSSTLDKVVPPKELYSAPPVFSFDSKNVNKFPPITFSSSSPVASEPSGPKFGAFSDPKLDSSSRWNYGS